MNNNDFCKIFLSYHKPFQLLDSEIFTPIQVGRASAAKILKNMIGDDTGENISSKNQNFCELTAQYWAWKNCNANYIGFMHYRRHLNFNENKNYESNKWGLIEEENINEYYIKKYGLDDENIKNVIKNYDIVTVSPWDVKNAGSKNNYDHYKFSEAKLHIKDYDLTLEILKQKYPEYEQDITDYNNSETGYYTNIFVMKNEIFNDYCSWLFDILFEVEKRVDISEYDFQEARIFGYLSEWLFGIYIFHQKRVNHAKVKELQRTIIMQDFVQNNENINICLSTDNKYAQHCAVAIASVIKSTKTAKGIDFYILNDGSLSQKNKKRLLKLKHLKKDVNINFLRVDKTIFENFPINTDTKITVVSYYRFVIPSLLNKIEKAIYLDCDLVVNGDIENLFNIDLENYYIAGAQDIIGFENQKRLELTSKYYINAGVLLMDLKKLRENNVEEKLIDFTLKYPEKVVWFDQDVINSVLEYKIKYLDLCWNLQYYRKSSPNDYDKETLKKAIKNAKIIHYIGYHKPWDFRFNRLYGDLYFKYLLFTPWKYKLLCYAPKFFGLIIKNALRLIFSIQNENNRKVFCFLGIKLKIKRKR